HRQAQPPPGVVETGDEGGQAPFVHLVAGVLPPGELAGGVTGRVERRGERVRHGRAEDSAPVGSHWHFPVLRQNSWTFFSCSALVSANFVSPVFGSTVTK